MTKIADLIIQYCPEGVRLVQIGDVVRIRNGRDHKELSSGPYPVYGSGGIMRYADTYLFDKPSVLLPRKGSLKNIFYVDTPFWTVDTIFWTEIDTEQLLPKFFYHIMLMMNLAELNQAGGVPSLTQTTLNRLTIPVPPLEVQHKIVELLDTYTILETTLATQIDSEITARKRQYAHYREAIFESDLANSKTIDEVAKIWRGRRFVKDDIKSEGVPAIHYGEIYTKYGLAAKEAYSFLDPILASKLRFVSPGDVVLVSAGETIEDIGKSFAWLGDQDVVIHDACYGLRSEIVDPRYMVHFFNTHSFRSQLRRYISTSKISAISTEKLGKVFIPVPGMERQREIANILDELDQRMESLLEDLSSEKKARRKQYIHYKQRVLTFPEMVAS